MGYGLTILGWSPMAIVPASFHPDSIGAINGIVVQRTAANLPQTGAAAIFNITGGLVRIVALFGRVTTLIQTQANNTKLKAKRTGGAFVDLCAVLDITAKAVGSFLYITGVVADAMVNSDVLVGFKYGPAGLILQPGEIDLDCAASNTGQVEWFCAYEPVQTGVGAAVTAA